MLNVLKFFLVVAVALVESFFTMTETWVAHTDLVFVLLLAFSIQKFGWTEILSFFAASLIIESVSIAPFGMYTLAIGLVVVVGRILFRTVFTQRSPYSLFLLSVSLAFIFGVIMSVMTGFVGLIYNENFGFPLRSLLVGFILNTIVLFFLLMLQAKRIERKYLSL